MNYSANWFIYGGMQKRSLLIHCATSRKVVSSIPYDIIGVFLFNLPNPASRTIALGLTQPLQKLVP
jgi:hypothetical protein